MAVDQRQFSQLRFDSTEPNPCSPKDPGPNWRGILIQAPMQVALKRDGGVGQQEAHAAIPICGYFMLAVTNTEKSSPMTLVAINKLTKKVYSGAIVKQDPRPREPTPETEPVDPELLKGLASGGYFNLNLVEYVRIPARPAVYDVVVEYGGVQSNTVTIEVVEGD
jgi:hypothetical protein